MVSVRHLRLVFLVISVSGYLSLVAAVEARDVSGALEGAVRWTKAESPYRVVSSVLVPEDAELVMEPGVRVQFSRGVGMVVRGRLEAEGSAEDPIVWERETKADPWGAVVYDSARGGVLRHVVVDGATTGGQNRIGMVSIYRCSASILIENCTFSNWPGGLGYTAVDAHESADVTVRHCRFLEGENEAVYGIRSPVVVEGCLFHPRSGYCDAIDVSNNKLPDPVPRILNNTFLGSEDDAIDLDDCDAFVDGNLVMKCRGGTHDPIGISGDAGSRPILINNIIIDCESGIGFKNGADILVVNNTIIDCDRGIWMHQNPAHATVINTIIWGRPEQVSIVLEPGSTIDVKTSVFRGDAVYPGEGNLNLDPRFVGPEAGDYHLLPDSPCIDVGTRERVPGTDYEGNLRPQGAGIDIGAYEYVRPPTRILRWTWW